ncbi:MAG: allantoinase PuuE [Alphaproteobacteria bacterium]
MPASIKNYPRDFYGHGSPNLRSYPNAAWPNGAKIAVQFVLNYEEGGERCLLHGDHESEAFLSEIIGAQPWENQRHWNMESMYDYGARAGFWRVHDLFTRHKLPLTIFGVATALKRSPAQVQAMLDAGWEIACHGLKWIDYKDHSPKAEQADMDAALTIHHAATGKAAQGWYTGRCSENTVSLAAETNKFLYISDDYSDDLPYYHKRKDGTAQLIIPYSLDCNDMRFATAQGFHTGTQFFEYLKDSFDCLYQEGAQGQPKLMNIGLHCRLIGRPGRIMGLMRFLDYIQEKQGVWIATRADIAEHWLANHKPQRCGITPESITPESITPESMTRDEFMALFGGIYEHSDFIAQRAFDDELSPVHNDLTGIAALLAFHFRSASHQERLGVLNAHPDLAGKLAEAKQLTKESTAEQAAAGLAFLSDDEKQIFTALNDRYRQKFGFPFILAVKGKNKQQILDSFHKRLDHSQITEFETACQQVEHIAYYRLETLFAQNDTPI